MDGRTAWAGGTRKRGQEAPATTLAEVSPMVCTLCGVCSHSRDVCHGLTHARRGRPAPPVRSVAPKPRTPQDKNAGYSAPSRPRGPGRMLYFPAAFTDIFLPFFGNIKPCNSNNYKEGRFKKWLLFP